MDLKLFCLVLVSATTFGAANKAFMFRQGHDPAEYKLMPAIWKDKDGGTFSNKHNNIRTGKNAINHYGSYASGHKSDDGGPDQHGNGHNGNSHGHDYKHGFNHGYRHGHGYHHQHRHHHGDGGYGGNNRGYHGLHTVTHEHEYGNEENDHGNQYGRYGNDAARHDEDYDDEFYYSYGNDGDDHEDAQAHVEDTGHEGHGYGYGHDNAERHGHTYNNGGKIGRDYGRNKGGSSHQYGNSDKDYHGYESNYYYHHNG